MACETLVASWPLVSTVLYQVIVEAAGFGAEILVLTEPIDMRVKAGRAGHSRI